MAKNNEITKSALYEMVKEGLINFAKKQKLQEEKAKIKAELDLLNEVRSGDEIGKGGYHAGQKEPVFNVKGTHLTEEGEEEGGDITSPEQVKSDADLDKYIQNLIGRSDGAATETQGVAEGDMEEGSYEEGMDLEMEEEVSEGEEDKKKDEMLPDWLKEELDEMEEEVSEEDMSMYEMEEVEEEDMSEEIQEVEIEEEVDLERIKEGLEAKMEADQAKEVLETVKENLNEGTTTKKSLISESEKDRLQYLAGL